MGDGKNQSDDDAKRDAVLKRMLETPHKPHEPLGVKRKTKKAKDHELRPERD